MENRQLDKFPLDEHFETLADRTPLTRLSLTVTSVSFSDILLFH